MKAKRIRPEVDTGSRPKSRNAVTKRGGAAAFAALCLAFLAVATGGQVATAGDPSRQIIAKLEAAADGGDPKAKAALADLQAFAARNGLSVSDLRERAVAEARAATPHVVLNARGVAPLWLDVFQEVTFDSGSSVTSYVAERRVVARGLGGTDRHRGRLAFSDFQPLTRLCDLRTATAGVIEDAEFDIWLGDTWVSRFGYGPDRPEFWGSDCNQLDAKIRDFLSRALVGDSVADSINDFTFSLRWATFDLTSDGISIALDDPAVLVFDPEEDLLQPWAARASHVRLFSGVDPLGQLVAERVARGEIANPFVPGNGTSDEVVRP